MRDCIEQFLYECNNYFCLNKLILTALILNFQCFKALHFLKVTCSDGE